MTMPTTVPALLAARAAADPDRVALMGDDGRGLTYQDWHSRSSAAARALTAEGLGRAGVVCLVFDTDRWTDFAIAYCAVQSAGGVAVPISARLPPREISDLARRCGAWKTIRADGMTALDPPGAVLDFDALLAEPPGGPIGAQLPPEPDDVAQILFTSGTTGEPKGVAATHQNLTFGQVLDPRRRAFAHSRILLHAFPIGTNAAQMMLLHALTAAPAVACMARFTPRRFARFVEKHRVGTVFLVPAMATELLASPAALAHDLSSLRLIGSSAAPLPAPIAARLAEAFPEAAIVNYYTSTEAAPAHTAMVFDPERPDSIGIPGAGCALKIADAAGHRLAPGEIGEVWLRASDAARRYLEGDPAETTFRDGWVRMGDLGRIDDEGHLYLVDRISDVVKCGAFKVSTLRVEAAVLEHDDVLEATAFALPHPVLGSSVAVAAVTRAPLSLSALRSFLGERLAEHEQPTRLLTMDALPRNDAGKVLKNVLRESATTRKAMADA
ncbi:class I adenylate-forming enzyme family protein [Actinospica robiniae]|uniref:class I adenylate-forming enzyme family protein n=1 Tax=Actinospica robiniae TaxID=304901 RepID=UPI0005502936|nr:class I adenylate-forming enzyme family protein [Actinospica robiniae]